MQIVIDIPEILYEEVINGLDANEIWDLRMAIKNGKPLTPDMLADLLMEERIRGELKQDISYSKDIIDNVRCKLTVDIIAEKVGKWIYMDDDNLPNRNCQIMNSYRFECSKCRRNVIVPNWESVLAMFPYCNCGCKMVDIEKDNTRYDDLRRRP